MKDTAGEAVDLSEFTRDPSAEEFAEAGADEADESASSASSASAESAE